MFLITVSIEGPTNESVIENAREHFAYFQEQRKCKRQATGDSRL